MTALLDEIHAASKTAQVILSKLRVDRTYQRVPSQQMIKRIADNWNLVASEQILVSDRGKRPEGEDLIEGGLFLVNGQHRVWAARRIGIDKLEARIIDLTAFENPVGIEAAFRLQTGVRLGDKTFERFRAQLAAGDEESLSILGILTKLETKPMLQPGDGGITAIASVESIYRLDGDGSLLTETLQTIKDTWGGFDEKKATAASMKGFAWFIENHAEETNRDRLIERMKKVTSAQADARARQFAGIQGGALWMNYYIHILDIYNDGLNKTQKLQIQRSGASSRLGTRVPLGN
jgi:hypothetical protein